MKCNICGENIKEGAAYCDSCGAIITYHAEQPAQQQTQQPVQSPAQQQTQQPVQSPAQQQTQQPVQQQAKSKNKGLIIGIIAGAAVLLIGIIALVAIILLRKKPKEVAEITTELTTVTITEETTEITTEATTEDPGPVPYYEEHDIKFSKNNGAFQNDFYSFAIKDGGSVFDVIEDENLEFIQHKMSTCITNVETSEPDESGYVMTKVYYDIDMQVEAYNHGYMDPWSYHCYCDLPTIVDYNTGYLCFSNSLDTGIIENGEEERYQEIASDGDARLRDDAFLKENMRYTKLEYDGEKYSIGLVTAQTDNRSKGLKLIDSGEKGDHYMADCGISEVAVIYAPKDCRLVFSIYKNGVTKESFDYQLKLHRDTATKTDSDKSDSDEEEQLFQLLESKKTDQALKPDDFISLDINEMIEQ